MRIRPEPQSRRSRRRGGGFWIEFAIFSILIHDFCYYYCFYMITTQSKHNYKQAPLFAIRSIAIPTPFHSINRSLRITWLCEISTWTAKISGIIITTSAFVHTLQNPRPALLLKVTPRRTRSHLNPSSYLIVFIATNHEDRVVDVVLSGWWAKPRDCAIIILYTIIIIPSMQQLYLQRLLLLHTIYEHANPPLSFPRLPLLPPTPHPYSQYNLSEKCGCV